MTQSISLDLLLFKKKDSKRAGILLYDSKALPQFTFTILIWFQTSMITEELEKIETAWNPFSSALF